MPPNYLLLPKSRRRAQDIPINERNRRCLRSRNTFPNHSRYPSLCPRILRSANYQTPTFVVTTKDNLPKGSIYRKQIVKCCLHLGTNHQRHHQQPQSKPRRIGDALRQGPPPRPPKSSPQKQSHRSQRFPDPTPNPNPNPNPKYNEIQSHSTIHIVHPTPPTPELHPPFPILGLYPEAYPAIHHHPSNPVANRQDEDKVSSTPLNRPRIFPGTPKANTTHTTTTDAESNQVAICLTHIGRAGTTSRSFTPVHVPRDVVLMVVGWGRAGAWIVSRRYQGVRWMTARCLARPIEGRIGPVCVKVEMLTFMQLVPWAARLLGLFDTFFLVYFIRVMLIRMRKPQLNLSSQSMQFVCNKKRTTLERQC